MDLKAVNKNDLGAMIAGVVALFFSFFSYYARASVKGFGSAGTSAWDSYATLGMLLILVALAAAAVFAFAGQVLPAGVPWRLIAAGVAGLGTLLLILRAFTYGDGGAGFSGVDVSVGPGWSAYLLFIATIAMTVFLVLGGLGAGQKFSDFQNLGNKGGPSTPPPPPPPSA